MFKMAAKGAILKIVLSTFQAFLFVFIKYAKLCGMFILYGIYVLYCTLCLGNMLKVTCIINTSVVLHHP